MKTALPILCLMLFPLTLWAAPAAHTHNSDAQALDKLDFLVGHWQGDGWIVTGRNHTRHTFSETESIEPKINGDLLLIEGHGTNAKGASVHEAVAVVTWDARARHYRWQAWSDGGMYLDTVATVADKTLVWSFTAPHAGRIRFTIKLDAQGHWVETGDISPNGKNWYPFFGMTLTRQQ